MCFLMELGVAVAILTAAVYLYPSWSWNYWKKRGVPQIESSFPWGNFAYGVYVRKNVGHLYQGIYDLAKKEKLVGVYMLSRPILIIRDPELIKTVLVKDFTSFHDRGVFDDSDREPLTRHLFFLPGQKWRNLRAKLSPTFTSGKMKMMFSTLVDTGAKLQEHLVKLARQGEVIEVKDILARYSTDVIASCAFGIECNCLKNPDAEFRQWGRKLFRPRLGHILFVVFSTLAPSLLKFITLLPIRFLDPKVTGYFLNMVKETVSFREDNKLSRNDFMQLLIQLKNKGYLDVDKEDKDSLEEIQANTSYKVAAQAFVFFLAGFETSSTAMTFCLYELSLNQEIQFRVQEEIDSVLNENNRQLTYAAVNEMEYLDKVVSSMKESLINTKKVSYGPCPYREVSADYKIPNSNIQLEKGTSVVIPILALQHDLKYFPDSQKFDPERFNSEEIAKRHHYTYLPFGEGPRICIGMRFGLLQTKVGLISVLSRYNIQVSEKTPIPIKYDTKNIVLSPVEGMWLKITERNNKTNVEK